MHPLAALGLDRDADERAVKRAYAQRLKTTRPDEDPQGFQALHETYQSALAYLRWREANPGVEDDDEEAEDEEADEAPSTALSEAEFAELIGTARYAPEPSPPPRAVPAFELREAIEPFRLDLAAFLKRLDDKADETDAKGLHIWLARQTSDWPIAVKPRIARDVLEHLIEESPDITPAQLEAIVDVFALDDVLTSADPLGLQLLRERLAIEDDIRQRREKLDYLWRPENRDELVRYMRQPERGGYRSVTTRMVAWLLTGPRAYEWAYVLRPVPFLTRIVTRFLRQLDGGHSNAMPDRIDAMTVEFWHWKEMRREANRGFRLMLLILGLAAAIVYATKDAPTAPGSSSPTRTARQSRPIFQPDPREKEANERVERAIALDDARDAEAVVQYDEIIRDYPPPWTQRLTTILSVAHYNKGVSLQRLGRLDEARAAYGELDRLFAQAGEATTAALVMAKGWVNLGGIQARAREFQEAILTYQKVLARHERSRVETLEEQVARALIGRGEAFRELLRPEEALHAVDEVLRRFGDRTTGAFPTLIERARRLRQLLSAPPNAEGGNEGRGSTAP